MGMGKWVKCVAFNVAIQNGFDTTHRTIHQPIDLDYVSKAIVGIASPVVGVITSFQEQIEWHLRVASLLVGFGRGRHGPRRDGPKVAGVVERHDVTCVWLYGHVVNGGEVFTHRHGWGVVPSLRQNGGSPVPKRAPPRGRQSGTSGLAGFGADSFPG